MTITEFLLARIAEDEEAARAAMLATGRWSSYENRDDPDWDGVTEVGVQEYDSSTVINGFALDAYLSVVSEHRGRSLATMPTADPDDWTYGEWREPAGSAQMAHIALHDPDRVLAECDAKRRIVEHQRELADAWSALGDALDEHDAHVDDEEDDTPLPLTLRALAAVYADHPDFREEWRP